MSDDDKRERGKGAALERLRRWSSAAWSASKRTAEVGKDVGTISLEAARSATEWGAGKIARWLNEDKERILDESPIAGNILAHRSHFESDPEVFASLCNVRVRPLLTASVLTAGGVTIGVEPIEHALAGLTRAVFDGKDLLGGTLQASIGDLVGADRVVDINRWMDTVPGAAVPGGGWTHRLQHGHDLAAVARIWEEHGSGGGIQALYHVYGRDFFTPAGIPVLPAGNREALDTLTRMHLSSKDSADLLSFNAIEVLGGVMTVIGVIRLARLAMRFWEDVRVRNLIERATRAMESDDFMTAGALLDEAQSLRLRDPRITFLVAAMNHRAGRALAGHFAFRNVVEWGARDESTIDVGGAAVSLRGIAATGALATSHAMAREDDYRDGWARHVTELARAGITAFETVANRHMDRRFVRQIGDRGLLPPNSLSAALNYYLAGQIAGAAMLLPDRDVVLERMASKVDACLCEADGSPTLAARRSEIAFMRRYVRAELLPPVATALG